MVDCRLYLNTMNLSLIALQPNAPKLMPPSSAFARGSEDMCRCGCRGWCSIYPLLDAWVQDLDKLQTAMKCAVMDIQCDWPAYLEIAGARFWNHSIHPCPLCNMSQDDMNPDILENITLDNLGFELYSDEQYKTDIDSFTKVSQKSSKP